MNLLCIVIIISSAQSICWACKKITTPQTKHDWWERAQFYQIYPRSFKDSNGDGIGDLKGITERLDYLKEIGITAAWLSPIFKSPMADFGYDISDFRNIQPEYGTMQDFENLIKKAKQIGLKIILDFVPNHSSDEHEWFQRSVNREKGYEDFYVWHDGYPDSKNASNRLPPSNWIAAFRGSAWEWNSKRKQFYLHQFVAKQPDLNYRSPLLVEAMKDILRFWLDKGVDGFRIDAVPCLFEALPDKTGRYPDEPRSYQTNDPEESAYLLHVYTQDQPETVNMLYQWREVLETYKKQHGGDTRVLLAETYSPIGTVMQYYGNGSRKGAHIPFNFNFITKLNDQSTAYDFQDVIIYWLGYMPQGGIANWVLGNHDQRRVGSRFGEDRIDAMNMLLMMLPGISVTYNGEEIGMLDTDISWTDSKDPAACNSNASIYEKFTRDPERSPFQWDATLNAGFSTSNRTWLPVNSNYKQVNVKNQNSTVRSHLNVFKDLVKLRKHDALQEGFLMPRATKNNVLVIERGAFGKERLILLVNFSNKKLNENVLQDSSLPSVLRCRIVSVNSKKSVGQQLTSTNIELEAYEAIIVATQ